MESIKTVVNYLKFYFAAQGSKGFGIHSPFVFNLVTQVIGKNKKLDCFRDIEKQRSKLLQNQQIIDVTDLGSGSTLFHSNQRKIKDIAAHSLKSSRQVRLLFRLVNHFQSKNIIEMGTSLGITTSYLAKANPLSKVITLEGCPEVSKIAINTFESLNINNIELINGEFNQTLPLVLDSLDTVDFVFFDGNHRADPTLAYFNLCLQKKHNDTLFVFDDINHNPEMESAWEQIKLHPETKVTIDLFWLGLVFFKKELTEQHYMVRF
ncbi:MAG: class I SAM-dependent methyltransferase [Salinivirgaceae bacterium]|jgi:predicted O-methyltransferase YrrM